MGRPTRLEFCQDQRVVIGTKAFSPRILRRSELQRLKRSDVLVVMNITQDENSVAFTVRAKPARDPNVSSTAEAS